MKHPKQITNYLLLWLAASAAFTIATIGVFKEQNESASVNPWLFGIGIIIAICLGTWFWLKFGSKKTLSRNVFAFGVGMLMGKVVGVLLDSASFWLRIAVLIPVLVLYGYVIDQIEQGKVKKWYKVNNAVMILLTVALGGMLSSVLKLWVALLLFALFALYDAWAVWKTKHMIVLAQQFVKNGILPGIVVPYGKKKMAMLGGGDIFFLSFIVNAFAQVNIKLAIIVGIAMTATLIALFRYSKPKKYYPALPFMFAGMLGGIIFFIAARVVLG